MNILLGPFALLLILLVVLIVYLRSDPGREFGHGERHVSMAALIGLVIALGIGTSLRQVAPAEVSDLRPRVDALEYDLASRSLARGEGFHVPYEDRVYPPRFSIGYPLLIAGTRLVTGHVDTPGVGAWVSWFFGGVVIALAFFLAHEIGGHRAGVAAAFLTALSPFQVYHSRQPMADMAALAFVLATLYLSVRALRKGRVRPGTLFLLAFLAGFATTIRVASALMIPIVAYVAVALVPSATKGRGLAYLALTAGLLLGVGPQLTVNWTQHGSPWRTGYSFWQPTIYGEGGIQVFDHEPLATERFPRDGDNFGAYARWLVPLDSFQDDRQRVEKWAETRPSLTREERRERRREKLHPYELVEREHDVEPSHLYPFFVLVLAIIGFGLSSREGEKRSTRLATAMTLIAGTLFFALYGVYPFQEARFLLPLQVLVLVFAARAFVARSRPLRIGVWVLAIYALWSALPELARATRSPQGNPPLGRSNEERTVLERLDTLLPETPLSLIVNTHGSLFEEELLDHPRHFVPLGLDAHATRIEAYGLESRAASREASAERLERLATYREAALTWTPGTQRLLTMLESGRLSGKTFDERDREWLLEHLESLPHSSFASVRALIERTRDILYEEAPVEAIDAHLAACREVSLGVIARRVDEMLALAVARGTELYYCDVSLLELGPLGLEIDRMLRDEARRRELVLATQVPLPESPLSRPARSAEEIDREIGFTPGEFRPSLDADGKPARILRPGFREKDEGAFHTLYRFQPTRDSSG